MFIYIHTSCKQVNSLHSLVTVFSMSHIIIIIIWMSTEKGFLSGFWGIFFFLVLSFWRFVVALQFYSYHNFFSIITVSAAVISYVILCSIFVKLDFLLFLMPSDVIFFFFFSQCFLCIFIIYTYLILLELPFLLVLCIAVIHSLLF